MTVPLGPPEVHDLPVQEILPDLRAALAERTGAVVVAPPGAGKTTLVPLALLDEPWLGDAKLLVLEPRRLAARAAARRMADLLGEDDAGGTVGYRVRMETRVSGRTRMEVVTEGILTRMLQSDPTLPGVGAVLFDEFHERSIHADLGMALALQARSLFRDDLRILAMSATIDAEPVAALLTERSGRAAEGAGGSAGDGRREDGGPGGEAGVRAEDAAPVLTSEGRTYLVETRFRERPVEGWIEPAVAATVREAVEREEGDVLVFLPGAGEIRRTADRLADGALPDDVTVHPLFGSLSRSEQDRAMRPSPPGARKIVLATSIAETSLTIEGVRVVVDSGLMRVPRFDPGTGMSRLETVRVTRDSADQRRGRAGRVAPGVCYRLWTPGEDRGLVPRRTPELLDADLAPLALELAVWGAGPGELRWLDPPPETSYAQGVELLEELEAIEPRGRSYPSGRSAAGQGAEDAVPADLRTDARAVTPHGRRMASIGMHPRLAHLVLRGRELGLEGLAVELAALLNGRDILRAEGRLPDADLRLRVEAVRAAREGGRARVGTIRGQRVDRGGLSRVLREVKHVRRSLRSQAPARDREERSEVRGSRSKVPGRGAPTEPADANPLDHVGLLTALAYPDRIGQRREGSRGRYRLRSGRGARFTEVQPLAASEWIVAPEVDGRGPDARIFRAAPLALAEIEAHFADQIEEVEEVVWDAEAERVRARRRRVLGALVLAEAPIGDPAPHLVARALVEGVRSRGLDALPWSKETRQLRERLDFMHHVDPERWPPSSEAELEGTLEEWLQPFLAGIRSFSGLDRLDLRQALLARVDRTARHRLDALAPTHLEVPSGSNVRIDYSTPEAPALAVRLQEVFGMTETPRVGGGRVPLTMKLLSPARRPVQVTQDLASFWRDAYFEVRKEMRGRYPKHPWPEDPLEAEPTRRTKRRR